MGLILFSLSLCLMTFEASQDPHAQPLALGRAVRAVHTSCRVLAAGSARQPRFAIDGRRRIDDTHGPVVSRDPHVPPSIWRDHGDAAGRRHDPWSSHRRHSCVWDGVFCRVEGLHRTGCWPSTPRRPRGSEGQEVDERAFSVAHNSLQHLPGGC
jgi:hypothetical protein